MTRQSLKRTLNIALRLGPIVGLGQAIHRTAFQKVISPIAADVWGS